MLFHSGVPFFELGLSTIVSPMYLSGERTAAMEALNRTANSPLPQQVIRPHLADSISQMAGTE
jgi:hypothetical protein